MEISVYGAVGCPRMTMVTEFISAGGALVKQVDIEQNPISSTVLDRLLAFESDLELSAEEAPAQTEEDNCRPEQENESGTGQDSDVLRRLLREHPSALAVPLAVRGSRVVVASSPARIQSLMY